LATAPFRSRERANPPNAITTITRFDEDSKKYQGEWRYFEKAGFVG